MTSSAVPGGHDVRVGDDTFTMVRVHDVVPEAARLPLTVQILLENALRHGAADETIERFASYRADAPTAAVPFSPERILLQDFTGVPVVADLAAMRDAVAAAGGNAMAVDPAVPVELVIDHSVVAEHARRHDALERNLDLEHERNAERYRFLRWGQQAFGRFQVFPPGAGICHQVNLEHLARVVMVTEDGLAHPDTLLGTDSHTPMVNGLGVLGWGVGGIEAEAAMLGVPVMLGATRVVGLRLTGALPAGATATDLVLTLTELLRRRGVVGSFVEVIGEGIASLTVEDRATIANMSPEFGATATLFPVDDMTLRYLRDTDRAPAHVDLVEVYGKEQGWWGMQPADDVYAEIVELDVSSVEPCVAGPSRPQDRVPLASLGVVANDAVVAASVRVRRAKGADDPDTTSPMSFPASDPPSTMAGAERPARVRTTAAPEPVRAPGDLHAEAATIELDGQRVTLADGDLVLAAITSCTNTSNPSVMLAAGLVARRAAERGLVAPPWVKTSLAPGSPVVVDYLAAADLLEPLATVGFEVVGFGCTTCIGNSGSLRPETSAAIAANELSVAAVLSGNRNFEGRIHPEVRLNFLASPPLVVALALAGTTRLDPTIDALARDRDGAVVRLADLWPAPDEIADARRSVTRAQFRSRYSTLAQGDVRWQGLAGATGAHFDWDPRSTYIRRPPFLDVAEQPGTDIIGARALLVLGDSITTDHISPAGVIQRDSPAARWLETEGVPSDELASYGARRGNHEVMVRGTFANIRLRNALVPGVEGPVTVHLPTGEVGPVFDVAQRYRDEGTPLVVLAGDGYGSGSSRDWAAKGTALLGVRAVVARSFERIHRANLIGMGVLPLELPPGETAASLGLAGTEHYDLRGIAGATAQAGRHRVTLEADGRAIPLLLRLDSTSEATQLRAGGILPLVRQRFLPGG